MRYRRAVAPSMDWSAFWTKIRQVSSETMPIRNESRRTKRKLQNETCTVELLSFAYPKTFSYIPSSLNSSLPQVWLQQDQHLIVQCNKTLRVYQVYYSSCRQISFHISYQIGFVCWIRFLFWSIDLFFALALCVCTSNEEMNVSCRAWNTFFLQKSQNQSTKTIK